MRYFLFLCAACLASLLAYFVLFGFVVSRPLVVDQIGEILAKKESYAAATPHPKLFIVAGSNARFSHSCAVIEKMLRRPCVNMGITAEIGLDWLLDRVQAQLAPGDLVYLPIEYDAYSISRTKMYTGVDAAYRFRRDKASLEARGMDGMLRAAFMFSLPTLVQSVGEMSLNAAGVQRRFNLNTLDIQGDETGHDGAKAQPYLGVVNIAPALRPDASTLLHNPDGAQAALATFLDWCRTHGVVAVGGLPTIFDDDPVGDAVVARLENFYAEHGARFVLLPNRSQYPRADFFDTGYHLRESVQLRHSQILASALRPLLP